MAKAQADGTMPAGPTCAAAPALVDKKTQPVAVATDTSAKRAAPRSPYAPTDPAQGLGEHEVAATLELKRKHPSMGPAQLKRFHG